MTIKDKGKKIELEFGLSEIPMTLAIAPKKKYRAVRIDSVVGNRYCCYDWKDTPTAALKCICDFLERSVSRVPPCEVWIQEGYPVEMKVKKARN